MGNKRNKKNRGANNDSDEGTPDILKPTKSTGMKNTDKAEQKQKHGETRKRVERIHQNNDEAQNAMTDDPVAQERRKNYFSNVEDQYRILPDEHDQGSSSQYQKGRTRHDDDQGSSSQSEDDEVEDEAMAMADASGDDEDEPTSVRKGKQPQDKTKRVKIKQEFTRGDRATNPIVVDEDWDLIKSAETQPTAGLEDPAQYRSLMCLKNGAGGAKIGIFKYGPRNRPVYRREEVDEDEYDSDVLDISDPSLRPGEKHSRKNGRKIWTFTRKNFVSVQGIAFPTGCSLKDLDPYLIGDNRPCPVDILIKWTSEGEESKSWETRTTFRRVWGKQGDGPDAAILEAAERAEKRYKQWYRGLYKSEDRSPTPDVRVTNDDSRISESDGESDGRSRSHSRHQRRTKTKKSKSKRSDYESETEISSDSESDRIEKTRKKRKPSTNDLEEAWCLMHGVRRSRLSERDEKSMRKFVRARKS